MANIITDFNSVPDYISREEDQIAKGYRDIGFRKHVGLQNAELNEMVAFLKYNLRGIVDALFNDGSILKGGNISIGTGTVTLGVTKILSNNYHVDVPATTMSISTTGTVILGIMTAPQVITETDDPTLLDPATGTENYNLPGAIRLKMAGYWCQSTADVPPGGTFYPIYTLIDNQKFTPDIIDPQVNTILEYLSRYDRAANGSYVSLGMRASFVNRFTDANGVPYIMYSLSGGIANVYGYQNVFSNPRQIFAPDIQTFQTMSSEPQTFQTPQRKSFLITVNDALPADRAVQIKFLFAGTDYTIVTDATATKVEVIDALYTKISTDANAIVTAVKEDSTTLRLTGITFDDIPTPIVAGLLNVVIDVNLISDKIPLQRAPIKAVTALTGQTAIVGESVTHGPALGSADLLSHIPVVSITAVKQGATTYIQGTDYKLTGNSVDWSLGGAEPAPGSTYTVDYVFFQTFDGSGVTISDDRTSISVSGFINNSPMFVTYQYWNKRRDKIVIDKNGALSVLQGDESWPNPQAPVVTDPQQTSLSLILVDRYDNPIIQDDFYKAYTMKEVGEMQQSLNDLIYTVGHLAALENARSTDPLNNKRGMFIDPLYDDDLRDLGLDNTLQIANRVLHLPISQTLYIISSNPNTYTLTAQDGGIVESQLKYTKSRKINEFLNPGAPIRATLEATPVSYRYVALTEEMTASDFDQDSFSNFLSTTTRTVNQNGTVSVGNPFLSGSGTGRDWFPGMGSRAIPTGSITSSTSSLAFNVEPGVITALDPRVVTSDINPGDWSPAVLAFQPPVKQFTINAEGYLPTETVRVYWASQKIAETTSDQDGKLIDFTISSPAWAAPGSNVVEAIGVESQLTARTTINFIPQQRLTINRNTVVMPHINVINTQTNTTTVLTVPPIGNAVNGNGAGGEGADPIAETWTPSQDMFIKSITVCFAVLPTTPVTLMIGPTVAGLPDYDQLMMSVTYQPSDITVGQDFIFDLPSALPVSGNTEYAFIVMTSDSVGELRVAQLNHVDIPSQQRITINPYLGGVLLNSSNAKTWSPIQDEDLYFKINKASFDTASSSTIKLGQADVTDATDFMILCGVNTPAGTSIKMELRLIDRGEIIPAVPYGPVTASAYTGTVEVWATLSTLSSNLTPEISGDVSLVAGQVGITGTYISRQFDVGGDLFRVYLEQFNPTNTTIEVYLETNPGTWQQLAKDTRYSVPRNDGFTEIRYSIDLTSLPALTHTRIKIVMSTTSATDRPMVANDIKAMAMDATYIPA